MLLPGSVPVPAPPKLAATAGLDALVSTAFTMTEAVVVCEVRPPTKAAMLISVAVATP